VLLVVRDYLLAITVHHSLPSRSAHNCSGESFV
jgi:hypothetical protein